MLEYSEAESVKWSALIVKCVTFSDELNKVIESGEFASLSLTNKTGLVPPISREDFIFLSAYDKEAALAYANTVSKFDLINQVYDKCIEDCLK